MKDRKGFTLIELIAVIVILGLVLLIAIPFFSGSLKTFRSDYYKNLNGNINNSGQNFFTDNRAFLPHNFLKSQVIDVNTLEEKRYVNPVKDYNGEKCDTKDSYIIAVKLSRDEYAYTTCLKCSSDEYDDSDQSEYCDPAWRDDTGLGYTDVSFVAANDVHVYRGTSRSDLKKLVVAYPTVKRCKGKPGDPCTKESGNLIKEVTAAGEDGIQPIYPMNLDTVDTNRVGVYTVQYKYNDDTPIVTGKVYVYENPAPVVSIKKTNKVLRVNQDQVTGTPHTINPNYDDTNPDDWAQELNFTFKYTFSSDADPRLKVTSYQYKINGRWEDYCTSISGSNGCTKNEIREMNEDVPFRMIDNQGHISAETRAYTLKIDNTKPKCEVYETGTMGDNDWYVSDVTIRFRSKSDQQQKNLLFTGARSPVSGESYSGITTGVILKNTVNYQKVDTNKVRWYGYIEDKANNYNTCYIEFKRDATAPICELQIPTVDGEHGWFKRAAVKVSFKTHTDTSGQADYSGVRDYGINTWNSGVKEDFQTVDTDNARWLGQIRDNAGNMSTCTIGFKKDSTPPTCTAKVPTPDGLEDNGKKWHKMSTVKVEINTTGDNLSGVNDYGINSWNSGVKFINHTEDIAGITYTYQIKDNAGNYNTCSVWFKKDSTQPTCAITTSGTTGNNGWYKIGTVNGSFTSYKDNLSGVKSYGFDSYSGNHTKSTTTSTADMTWTGYVQDKAGNTNSCTTWFKFDNNAPTCVSGGGSTWTNQNVTITGTCSDTGYSGCVKDISKTYSNEINSSTETAGTVYDNAGNSVKCPANQTVQIDKTKPSCSLSKAAPNGKNGWHTSATVTVSASFKDNGTYQSGISQKGTAKSSGSTNGNSSVLFSEDGASLTAYCYVKDVAGNDYGTSLSFKKDSTPPTCKTTTTSEGWTNQQVTITGNCSDSTSGCVGNTEAKFADQQNTYQIPPKVADNAGNEGSCQSIQVKIDRTLPICSVNASSTGLTLSCSDEGGSGWSGCAFNGTSSASKSLSVGTHAATVTDVAGNVGTCSRSVWSTYVSKYNKTTKTCGITSYTYSFGSESSSSVSSCSSSNISCNASNYGSYHVSCTTNYKYEFNYSYTAHTSSCSASSPFTCTSSKVGSSYTHCTKYPAGDYAKGVFTCAKKENGYTKKTKKCNRSPNYGFSDSTSSVTSCSTGNSFTCNSNNDGSSYVSACTPTEYSCSSGTKLTDSYCA